MALTQLNKRLALMATSWKILECLVGHYAIVIILCCIISGQREQIPRQVRRTDRARCNDKQQSTFWFVSGSSLGTNRAWQSWQARRPYNDLDNGMPRAIVCISSRAASIAAITTTVAVSTALFVGLASHFRPTTRKITRLPSRCFVSRLALANWIWARK